MQPAIAFLVPAAWAWPKSFDHHAVLRSTVSIYMNDMIRKRLNTKAEVLTGTWACEQRFQAAFNVLGYTTSIHEEEH